MLDKFATPQADMSISDLEAVIESWKVTAGNLKIGEMIEQVCKTLGKKRGEVWFRTSGPVQFRLNLPSFENGRLYDVSEVFVKGNCLFRKVLEAPDTPHDPMEITVGDWLNVLSDEYSACLKKIEDDARKAEALEKERVRLAMFENMTKYIKKEVI